MTNARLDGNTRPRCVWRPAPLALCVATASWCWPRVSAHGHFDSRSDGAHEPKLVGLQICALVVLLALSAAFAGLGLGLMSLDLIGLQIVVAAGDDEKATPKEKRQGEAARKIIPLRKKGNLLLTTFLMGNVAVNSLNAIIMADLTSGLTGAIVSTILIVLFGEIVPQAICTKHALEIGGRVIPFVKVLIGIFYIFAKPVSMILDATLGEDIGTVFTKRQLTEMIEIHEKEQMIHPEEGGILRGAMSFSSRTAKDIMTPVNQVFMLPISSHSTFFLDEVTIQKVLESGYSRIPIYGAGVDDIVSTINVKDLVFVDPKEQVQLSSYIHIFGRNVQHIDPHCTLDVLLQAFKRESTHIALITRVEGENSHESEPIRRLEGIVTLEDVLEEILQDEILDEADVAERNENAERKRRLSCLYGRAGRLSLADLSEADGSIENVEALAKHLQETNPIFRSRNAEGIAISHVELAEFLSTCTILDLKGDTSDEIFTRDVETCFCVVVLQGRLRVESTGGRVEVGVWGVLAADSLVVQEGLYRSDVTVRTVAGVPTKLLRLARADFQERLHPVTRRRMTRQRSGA
ncbi:hypothetical protein PINS_up013290 [Pythium insidiosum]|nr:hypothetical protein PINS_up013290 [Pythium insidiosum]